MYNVNILVIGCLTRQCTQMIPLQWDSLGLCASSCKSVAWNVWDLLLWPTRVTCLQTSARLSFILHSCCWIHWSDWTHHCLPCELTGLSHWFLSPLSPFPSSVLCLNSAHRELKVCWSRLLAPRSCPLRALRGNLRQLVPAQAAALQGTLTSHGSSLRIVGPATLLAPKAMPLRHDKARVDWRKINVQLCIFPTLPLTTLFPIQLWNLPPAPKAVVTKGPSSPRCTDWRVKAHVWSLHAETQADTSSLISKRSFIICFFSVLGQVIAWEWRSQICVSVWWRYSEIRSRGMNEWTWKDEMCEMEELVDDPPVRHEFYQHVRSVVLSNSSYDTSASLNHFES